ncbi:cytochrome c-type biogenesis protein [Marinobacterium rhizophilum]|uniref:Cytochrome c-type biogenesis protein n=1 Tax=Marinobacterium rhizophilum TaxID=420402 RepID=A0ABY5HFG4_9GAMM|nr:cytochrome c-type biogenesis protein [Marinobacterium rhizophilum]UTW10010.1 cytochrome c-type biogenesis protein CcmH [Marinobacterium rhizophilum]
MRQLLIALLLWLPLTTQAAIDSFEFRDEATRERFQSLTAELRCPKCQNQNIADSNSPIAEDLRTEIHRMLQQGDSDQDIVDFMVARYGEFVLYRPRLTPQTLVLWYGPFGLLAIGAVVILVMTRRRRRASNDGAAADVAEPAETLSAAERRRLEELLKQDDK